ncbi:alkaline phosphatase, partial [Tropilaelaps mercedesae]
CTDTCHTARSISKVILGGGRKHFLPINARPASERRVDIDNPAINGRGVRTDGRNLIEEWLDRHNRLNHSAAYLWNKSHLDLLHEGDYNEDYILGLFAPDSFSYAMDKILAQHSGEEIPGKDQPTLEEMTRAAINKLNQSPSGFVLFVEGARIDTAHHDNLAGYSLEEVYQLDKAIEAADGLTSEQDTLTIVTADHSHAFTINGYATRGNDILGHAGRSISRMAYSTLSYAAGPGALLNEEDKERFSLVNNFLQPAMAHTKKGVHGGEDVAVYAKGPWAHLFSGTHDNTFIPHALAYAACIGLRTDHCDRGRPLSRYAHVHGPLRSVRHLGDTVKVTASTPENLTMIDHINGQTIAPDVLKTSLPPPILVPSQKIGHHFEPIPSVGTQGSHVGDVLLSRQSIPLAFDATVRDLQNPSRLGDVARSRAARKIVRRTNPFNAQARLYRQQKKIMLDPQSAANI